MGYGTVRGRRARPGRKYDHATAIAASLSYMAIQQQDSVGLAIFDQALSRYFKPSNSPGQWKIVVNELQQVPRWNKTNTGKILDQIAEKLTHRSLIVILFAISSTTSRASRRGCGICGTRNTRSWCSRSSIRRRSSSRSRT